MKRLVLVLAFSALLGACSEDPIDACVNDFALLAQQKPETGACKKIDESGVQEAIRRAKEKYPNLSVSIKKEGEPSEAKSSAAPVTSSAAAKPEPDLLIDRIDAAKVIAGLPLSRHQVTESGNGRKKQQWKIKDAGPLGKLEIIGNNQSDADLIGWNCAQFDSAGNSISHVPPDMICHRFFVQVLGKFTSNPAALAEKLIVSAEKTKTTQSQRIGDFSFETGEGFYFVRRWSRLNAR